MGRLSDRQARQSLRQALTLLRKELPTSAFMTDTKIVRLDPASWSIDAREFASFAGSQNAEDLERAARLLTGDFLSGFILEEESSKSGSARSERACSTRPRSSAKPSCGARIWRLNRTRRWRPSTS